MREFDKWWSEFRVSSLDYSDRDICKDAFKAGMLAATQIAADYQGTEAHGGTIAEYIRGACQDKE